MENSGKQNPKSGFKSPPEHSMKRATLWIDFPTVFKRPALKLRQFL